MNSISPGPITRSAISASGAKDNPWFLRPHAPETTGPRLFCFPCAGHGAAMYQGWFRAAGARLDLFPVQPPGRANRLSDAPLESIPELAGRIACEIAPLTDRPYALFGHSMGAVVAALTADALLAAGAPPPVHLFVSSRQPPDVPSPVGPLSHLADDEFVAEINRRYSAIPQQILCEPDILAMLLPALRADVRALEAVEGHKRRQLAMPITAYGGEGDALVPRLLLERWEGWTQEAFRLRMFPGGHFYLQEKERDLLSDMEAALSA